MIIGYARVSTDGQTLDAQQAALKANGAERIFSEKISGAVMDRQQLSKALQALGTGDVLLVTRLDRLARSTRDLLNILDQISKAGAKFRSLADAWADTSTMHGELMVTILAGLITSEWWPASVRNGGRFQIGIPAGRRAYNSHAGRSVTCATPTASAQRTSASTTADPGITDHQHQ